MRLAEDVVEVIARSTTSGNRLDLPSQLDRKLYVRVAKAIEAAGGKWDRKAGAHIFGGDAGESIEPIILDGEITDAKREFNLFETPEPLIERMIDAADIPRSTSKDPRDWPRILEPSAGSGRIVKALHKRSWDHPLNVFAYEIQPALAAKVSELLYPEGSCSVKDFLSVDPNPIDPLTSEPFAKTIDRVIMNPPFSKRQDVRHVMHAFKFLKPGGRLVAIMSAGVDFREDRLTHEFRALVTVQGGSIERLPADSFKSSGTGVNTVFVTIPA